MATVAAIITALAAIGGTTAGISAQKSAKKRAASQTQQAERVRGAQTKRQETLLQKVAPVTERPATFEEKAQVKGAAEVARRKRRRTKTILTGPRGALEAPTVGKKALLGL